MKKMGLRTLSDTNLILQRKGVSVRTTSRRKKNKKDLNVNNNYIKKLKYK